MSQFQLDPTQVGSSALKLEQAVLSAINEVTSAVPTAVPVPADATLASIEVATKFAQYVTDEFLPTVADALTKLSEGAGILPQIASGFVGADEGGGAGVLQAGAGGFGPLTEAFGPLAGALGTIPQMVQSMTQEAAVTEEYAAHTEEDRRDEEEGRDEDGHGFPGQGATFV